MGLGAPRFASPSTTAYRHVVGTWRRRVRMPVRLIVAWCLLSTMILANPAFAGEELNRTRALAPGIHLRRVVLPGPVRLLVLRIDPAVVDVAAATATGSPTGYATLSEVASRERALLAVNGDLAAGNGPAHPVIHDGALVGGGGATGGMIAIDASGTHAAMAVVGSRRRDVAVGRVRVALRQVSPGSPRRRGLRRVARCWCTRDGRGPRRVAR